MRSWVLIAVFNAAFSTPLRLRTSWNKAVDEGLQVSSGFGIVQHTRSHLEDTQLTQQEPFLRPPEELPADSGRIRIGSEKAQAIGVKGFEGSFYTRTLDGNYHFLSAGRLPHPPGWDYSELNVHMRFDHWISRDGVAWEHNAKIYESTGNFNGSDRRASSWAPMAAFDPHEDRWHLFYVSYRASPDYKHTRAQHFYDQWDGEIFHAISKVPGDSGIGGPYADVGTALDQESHGGFSRELDSWEGDHGVDMFFPFQVDGKWLALYGSEFGFYPHFCKPTPCRQASTARLEGTGLSDGRWIRTHEGPLDASFRPAKPGIENPVVVKSADGSWFIAVYHIYDPGTIGVSFSKDGINWIRQSGDVRLKRAGSGSDFCDDDVTTVCGLVPAPHLGKGVYSVMYTAGGGGPGAGGAICQTYLVNEAEAETTLTGVI